MKIGIFAFIVAFASIMFASCDDTTGTIGNSLTDNMDMLKVSTDTFNVSSESKVAGAVLSRNTTGYLGIIRDPETGNYITGDFMAQFGTLEDYNLPELDSIVSLTEDFAWDDTREEKIRKVIADSCHIRLFFQSYYGDSLATMNLTAYEMAKPMSEGMPYYSDFDPMAEGYVDANGYKVNKTYTLTDLSVSEDERWDASSYTPNIKITLDKPYTDKDGVTYNNYGTYIMRKYYNSPESFKNSYKFIHDVCPGFYFKMNDGLGSMAYVMVSQLNIYFRYNADTTYVGTSTFSGTEEVLQTTNIGNDGGVLDELEADETCTYLKTPAGLFTVLTLPVDEVMRGHENDTLNTAKLVLTRINNTNQSDYSLDYPTTLLMIPLDSINSFFENEDIIDYKNSFYASFDVDENTQQRYNTYTFNNISGMITYMNGIKEEERSDDWNKVVVIPVSITTNSSNQIVKVVHDMSLKSTRLVRGLREDDAKNIRKEDYPIKLSVVYSKFSHE